MQEPLKIYRAGTWCGTSDVIVDSTDVIKNGPKTLKVKGCWVSDFKSTVPKSSKICYSRDEAIDAFIDEENDRIAGCEFDINEAKLNIKNAEAMKTSPSDN